MSFHDGLKKVFEEAGGLPEVAAQLRAYCVNREVHGKDEDKEVFGLLHDNGFNPPTQYRSGSEYFDKPFDDVPLLRAIGETMDSLKLGQDVKKTTLDALIMK